MDPCTLSSIKLFTEGVLILSPCPRTPESCQNLLVVVVIKVYARAQVFALFSRARLDQFYHLSAAFLAAYAASHRVVVVVVALLFYVHGKRLRSCRDGQLT